MSSNCFRTGVANFFKSVKDAGNTSTNFRILEQNSGNPITTAGDEHFRNSENSNVYVVIAANDCSVTVKTKNGNSTSLSKNQDDNDVIVIDGSDNSEADVKYFISKNERDDIGEIQNGNYSSKIQSETTPSTFLDSSKEQKESSGTPQCILTASAKQPLQLLESSSYTSNFFENDTSVSENHNRTEENSLNEKYCKFCKRTFSTSQNYINHRDFCCPFQRKYQIMCKLCEKKYASRRSFELHVKTVHSVKYKSANKNKLLVIVPIDDTESVRRRRFRCNHCEGLFLGGVKIRKIHEDKCKKKRFFVKSSHIHQKTRAINFHSQITPNKLYSEESSMKFEKFQCKHCQEFLPGGLKIRKIHEDACENLMFFSAASKIDQNAQSTNFSSQTAHKKGEQFSNKFQCNLCGKCMSGSKGLKIHKHHCKKLIVNQLEENDKVMNERKMEDNYSSNSSLKENGASGVRDKRVFNKRVLDDCHNNSTVFHDGMSTENISEVAKVVPKRKRRFELSSDNYCRFCKRSYSDKRQYNVHRDFNCPYQRKLQVLCKICGKKYSGWCSHIKHLKKVHNIDFYKNREKLGVIIPIDDQKSVRSLKRFRCEHCDGLFADGLKTRKIHLKVCSKIKHVSKTSNINITGANFVLKTTKNHKIHEKKFKCNLCGQFMSETNGLKIHKHHCRKNIARQLEQNSSNKVANDTGTQNDFLHISPEIPMFQFSSEEHTATGSESFAEHQFPELNNRGNISNYNGNERSIHVSDVGNVMSQSGPLLSDNYCKFCKLSYYSDEKYHKHRDFHCPFQRKFQVMCKLCSSRYTGRNVPVSHLRKVHNIKCSKNRSKFEIVVPIDDKKSVNSRKRYRCKYCYSLFPGFKKRENHLKKCLKISCALATLQTEKSRDDSLNSEPSYNRKTFKENFQCNFCGKCMSGTKGLKIHKYHCRKMSKEIELTNNVEKENKTFLGINSGFKCSKCNTTFHNNQNLRRHLRNRVCQKKINRSSTEISAPFQCTLCRKKFRYENVLKYHELYCCKQENKLYSCPKCRNQYSHYQSYKHHKKTCKDSNLPAKLPYFQFYKCGICERNNFQFLSLFKKHFKMHDRILIKCNVCYSSFTNYNVFRSHLKKRINEPYKCGSLLNFGGQVYNDQTVDDNLDVIRDKTDDNVDLLDKTVDNVDLLDKTVDNVDLLDKTVDNVELLDKTVDNVELLDKTVDNVELPEDNQQLCNVCSKKFSSLSLLIDHIHKHLQVEGDVE